MSVNKICFIIIFFIPLISLSQIDKKHFFLNKKNKDYFYKIDENNKLIFISSLYEKNKQEKNIKKGYEPNVYGYTFNILKIKKIEKHQFKNLLFINFKWLEDNNVIKHKKNIEVNNFENLYFVLRKGKCYFLYKVIREIYEY